MKNISQRTWCTITVAAMFGLPFVLILLLGTPDNVGHRAYGDAKPSGSWAPTAPSGHFFPNSPTMPYTVNSSTGAMLMDVGSGTISAPASMTLAGTVSNTPLTAAPTLAVGSGTISATATPAALPSNACTEATLVTSGTGVLCGTGTGACSVPLPQNMPLKVRVANTNQLYIGSGGTVAVGYFWSN